MRVAAIDDEFLPDPKPLAGGAELPPLECQ